jgi:hypothetical protein
MKTYNDHGELIGETNTSTTDKGDRVVANTVYHNGNAVSQHISVRDNAGKVRTTNIIGGKILP